MGLRRFSADPEDYTVDGEVVCQTVKEALLALKTVSADQLKTAVRTPPTPTCSSRPSMQTLSERVDASNFG